MISKRFAPTLVAILIATLILPAAGEQKRENTDTDGFTTLFNGTDLDGWDGDERLWSVEDGAITGRLTAENQIQRNSFLIWRGGTLRDFELRIKFKIAEGNSGVQYRSRDLGDHSVAGYQADLVPADPDRYTGILYEERGRGIIAERGQIVRIDETGNKQITGSLGDAKELAKAIKPGEWNEYTIIARGNHLVQKINGVQTIDVIDNEQDKSAREGILALQLHTGPPMKVQYKDIRLKELNEE